MWCKEILPGQPKTWCRKRGIGCIIKAHFGDLLHAPAVDHVCVPAQLVAGTSFMNFRNDMAIAGNLAAQFSPTSETQVVSRCSLNSKQAGSVSMRVTSHDYPQLGFSLIIPIASAIINRFRGKDVY